MTGTQTRRIWRTGCARAVAVLVLLATSLTAACGRKAPPLPPRILKPDATRDLEARQIGTEAVLTLSYPSMTSAGGPLPELESLEVWRLTLPRAQEPPATGSVQDRRVRENLLEAQGELLVTLDPDALASATRGSTLRIEDDLRVWHDASEVPAGEAVLWYAVRARCCGDRLSDWSNIARLEPQAPPDPPSGLSARPEEDGIRLEWAALDGAQALVERSADAKEWSEVGPGPTTEAGLLDRGAGQGQTWRYRLRAVRELDGGATVTGPPGEVVTVDYPDVYPPAAPADLVCLPESDRVRLVWQEAEGAAAYRVTRRREVGEEVELATELTRLSFVDSTAPAGSVSWLVEAVDPAGNRSEPVSCSAIVGATP